MRITKATSIYLHAEKIILLMFLPRFTVFLWIDARRPTIVVNSSAINKFSLWKLYRNRPNGSYLSIRGLSDQITGDPSFNATNRVKYFDLSNQKVFTL